MIGCGSRSSERSTQAADQSTEFGVPALESFQSDIYSGNATVAVPFDMPPGPAGIAPGLGLSYSSLNAGAQAHKDDRHEEDEIENRRKIGHAGIGWSLSGLSYVHGKNVVIGGVTYRANGEVFEQFNNMRIKTYDCISDRCPRVKVIDGEGNTYEFGGHSTAARPIGHELMAHYAGCKDDPSCFKAAVRYSAISQWTNWTHGRRPERLWLRKFTSRLGHTIRYYYAMEVSRERDGLPYVSDVRLARVIWAANEAEMKASDDAFRAFGEQAAIPRDKPGHIPDSQLLTRFLEVLKTKDAKTRLELRFGYAPRNDGVKDGQRIDIDKERPFFNARWLTNVQAWAVRPNGGSLVRGWRLEHVRGEGGDDEPYLKRLFGFERENKIPMTFEYYSQSDHKTRLSLLRRVHNGYGGFIDFDYERERGSFHVSGVVKTKTVHDGQGNWKKISFTRDLSASRTGGPHGGWGGSSLVFSKVQRNCVEGEYCPQSGVESCSEHRFFGGYSTKYIYSDGTAVQGTNVDPGTRGLYGRPYQTITWLPKQGNCPEPFWVVAFDRTPWSGPRLKETRNAYRVQVKNEQSVNKTWRTDLVETRSWACARSSGSCTQSHTNYSYDEFMNPKVVDVYSQMPGQNEVHERHTVNHYWPPVHEEGHPVLVSRLSETIEKVRDIGQTTPDTVMGHAVIPADGYLRLTRASDGRSVETSLVTKKAVETGPVAAGCTPSGDGYVWTETDYDGVGNPIRGRVAGKLQSETAYDNVFQSLPVVTRNAKGHATRNCYDNALKVTVKVGPYQGALGSGDRGSLWYAPHCQSSLPQTRYAYDGQGRVIRTRQPTGVVNTVDYTAGGAPGGGMKLVRCDAAQDLGAFGFSKMRCTTSLYDGWGKLLETIAPGRPSGPSLPVHIQKRYDGLGREIKTSLPFDDGTAPTGWATVTYTPEGEVVRRDPAGVFSQSCPGYLGHPNLVEVRGGSGATPSCDSDAPHLRRTRTHNNALGQVAHIEQMPYHAAAGHYTSFYRDGAGRVRHQRDALQNADGQRRLRTFSYDYRGQTIETTDPDRGLTRSCYDAWGRTTEQSTELTRAKQGVIKTVYDELGRPIELTTPDSKEIYVYDQGGNSTLGKLTYHTYSLRDLLHVELKLGYDFAGRVETETLTQGGISPLVFTTHYSSVNGDVYCRDYPEGHSVRYRFDINTPELLKSTYRHCSCASNCAETELVREIKKKHGNPSRVTYGDNSVDIRTYDAAGRLYELGTLPAVGPVNSSIWDRYYYENGFGNITAIDFGVASASTGQFSAAVRRNYQYDAFDRLTMGEQIGGRFPFKESYVYDAIGNFQTVTTQRPSRPGGPWVTHTNRYTYDDANRGHLTGGVFEGQAFAVDGFASDRVPGLIASKEGPDGRNLYELYYDARGRVTSVRSGSHLTGRHYGPQGLDNIYWIDSSSSVTARRSIRFGLHGYEQEHETPGNRMTTRIKLGALLGTVVLEGTTGQALAIKHVYHKDHIGSPRWTSGAGGTHIPQYAPFGLANVFDSSGKRVDETKHLLEGYTGQRTREYGALIDYGARFYDPALARFLQPDPLIPNESNGQDYNAYAYVRNNPIKYNDPTGMWPELPNPIRWLKKRLEGTGARARGAIYQNDTQVVDANLSSGYDMLAWAMPAAAIAAEPIDYAVSAPQIVSDWNDNNRMSATVTAVGMATPFVTGSGAAKVVAQVPKIFDRNVPIFRFVDGYFDTGIPEVIRPGSKIMGDPPSIEGADTVLWIHGTSRGPEIDDIPLSESQVLDMAEGVGYRGGCIQLHSCSTANGDFPGRLVSEGRRRGYGDITVWAPTEPVSIGNPSPDVWRKFD